ncbi:DDE superfamily endonuclease [Nitzschia inconspicua]|uniref:DDE superfamily endonuclease n=1 Tax=Nitzschia inconspicua TaxID=303405 RepID=A0A9K3KTT5_9STRA|nr:DDE superfamily endonuclease [Nitzschia inconspicua]
MMCLPLPATSSNDTPPRRIRRRQFAFRRKKGVIFYRDDKGNLLPMPPTMSSWYKMYCEEDSQATIKNFHEKFRRRFRLPHNSFIDLVEKGTAESNREDGLFSRWRPGKQAVSGQVAAPLNLLALTSLRYLGRGWTFDDLEEATAISEEVIRTFFHEFIEFGATKLYPEYVVPPPSVEEAVAMCCTEYEAAGYPGCCGSMDATHVEHSRISYRNRQAHLSFKLPFTARTYNLVTSHRRRIFCTTDGHPARWNDKSLVRFDALATALHDGTSPLCALEFELYALDENGEVYKEKCKGGWLLVDNGYLNWGVTIPPIKESSTRAEWRFSKWLESLRKDVECTFGIMKGRWRILKAGIRVHGTEAADKIWKTCCALHNWLLEADGLDKTWGSDYVSSLGTLNEDDMPLGVRALFSRNNIRTTNYDSSGMGRGNDGLEDEEVEADEAFQGHIEKDSTGAIIVRKLSMQQFRERLVVHFDIAFKRKEIQWPRARLGLEEPTI